MMVVSRRSPDEPDLIVALPGDSAKQEEEGVVSPQPPVVGVHAAVPGRDLAVRKLLLVDVVHRRVGDREGQRQELEKFQVNMTSDVKL